MMRDDDGLDDDIDDFDDFTEEDLDGSIANPALTTAESRAMIFDGLLATDLAQLFGVTKAKMLRALVDIEPRKLRRGKPIYDVCEVAYKFVEPTTEQIEAVIREMSPKDLPPPLQRAFWSSQRERQRWKTEANQLWHTSRVRAVIADLLMLVRQRLMLTTDHIDRLAPLSEDQRAALQATLDGILTDMRNAVVEQFKGYDGAKDRQEVPYGSLKEEDGLADDEPADGLEL